MATDKQSFLLDLQQRLGEIVRNSPASDIERNLKAVLAQAFQRMELVTREEFDATVELLASTRKRLEVLERTVADLESRRPGDGPQVGFGTDGSAASAADS